MTASRMISGLLWKYLNGSRFVMDGRYETVLHASTQILLTKPTGLLEDAAALACDGQKANLENFRSHNLVVSIGAHLNKSDNLLAEIRTQLNS